MRQDTDVARMAAALRAPALKYRSFGNEPVRNAPEAVASTDEQAFSILGDALAGANDLPPDAVLGEDGPRDEAGRYAQLQPVSPRASLARDAYPAARQAVVPQPVNVQDDYGVRIPSFDDRLLDDQPIGDGRPGGSHAAAGSQRQKHESRTPAHATPVHATPVHDPAAAQPYVPAVPGRGLPRYDAGFSDASLRERPIPAHPVPDRPPADVTAAAMPYPGATMTPTLAPPALARLAAFAPASPSPRVPPRQDGQGYDAQGSTLLQLLLGGAPPAAAPASPSPVTSAPPSNLPDQPATAAPTTAPGLPAPAPWVDAPGAEVVYPRPAPASLGAPPIWSAYRNGSGTGSSLLDTLFGSAAGTTNIHYPLLDALGDAMRGTTAEPSPRHWPAARVDIALPELLRRVAAGVRVARSAA